MMNATVEKLVKAVEERMVLKGYAVSFTENKKNNVGIKPGISIWTSRSSCTMVNRPSVTRTAFSGEATLKSPSNDRQMHFGAEQQPSHSQQSHGRQSFASRQIGSTHWTFALGFVLVGRNCSSASSEEYSDEKIRTLPSLPKRIHFFEKEVRPSTVQGGFIGVV